MNRQQFVDYPDRDLASGGEAARAQASREKGVRADGARGGDRCALLRAEQMELFSERRRRSSWCRSRKATTSRGSIRRCYAPRRWCCSTRSIFCPTSRSILDRFFERVRQLNSSARVFTLSALTGQGMAEWYGWVRSQYARSLRPTRRLAACRSRNLSAMAGRRPRPRFRSLQQRVRSLDATPRARRRTAPR